MIGFENPELLALLALAVPALFFAWKSDSRYGTLISISNAFLVSLLVLAAASPYINTESSLSEQPEVVLLKDESTSATLLDETELDLGDVEVREKVIASGNNSDLRNGIMRNLEKDTSYLMVSDFQSSRSLEGIEQEFEKRNSTLNALRPETENEVSVSIEGPETTVPGASNTFQVNVRSTSKKPEPEVLLDGSTVDLVRVDNDTWKFSQSFSKKGDHRVEARINVEDKFSQNNRYYHAVDVTEKPEVLILGSEGDMGNKLEEFYKVEYRSSLPDDLSDYYTVILKEDPEQEPVEYVSRGNGLVYTGGYEEDMNILPVRTVSKDDQESGAKIVLAIDISIASGKCSKDTCFSEESREQADIKRSKQIAYNIVEVLPYNNRVGAIAYNGEAWKVSKPKSLASNREELKTKIARLDPEGPSFHNYGIQGAKEMLEGEGNIILISDGEISAYGRNSNLERKSKDIASNLDVSLITVGVGEERNVDFLEDLARRGNGHYLDAEDSGRLQFQFEAGGASGDTVPLTVVNPNHFVTDGLKLSSSATQFDPVELRKGADLLTTGTDGRPVLTTWRYGIGRVAAFSADDPELSQISRYDPRLLTRTVSWTVGDPKRKQDEWMEAESARRPETVKIQSSEEREGFKRQGENLYTLEVNPDILGFHGVEGELYSYNYNEELGDVGYSEDMREIVRSTGGKVYSPDEEKIQQDLKKFSEREVVTKKSLSSYLLVAALLLFLAEVGYRKMNGKK